MILMRRCFLSVAKRVKFCRISSTTSGRSMLATVALHVVKLAFVPGFRRSRQGPHISMGIRTEP